MENKQIAIEQLIPADYNPRLIDSKELEKLKRSIREHGFVEPVVVNKDMTIIGGHQRIKAAKELGYSEVPCVIVDLPKNKEKTLNLALNRISGEWDDEKLQVILSQMDEEDRQLTGFDPEEISKQLDQLMNPDEDGFEPDLGSAEATAKQGDMWKLGEHRLMCGDSTNPIHVQNLMQGERAAMTFTDPPYNIAYEGGMNTHGQNKREMIMNDKMTDAQFYDFLYRCVKNMLDFTDGCLYICMSSSELVNLKKAFEEAGGHYQSFIIWVKNTFTLSRSDWQNQYEPILYGWRNGVVNHYFVGHRNMGNTWENLEEVKPRFEDGKTTIKLGEYHIELDGEVTGRIIRKKDEVDIWKENKPTKSKEHPCLPAGEMVLVGDVWKAIETVQVGERTNYGMVVETSQHDADAIVEITLEDGTITRATENHPFLVSNGAEVAWKNAELIKQGDSVLTKEKIHGTMKPLCTKKDVDTLQKKDIDASGTKADSECSTALCGNSITEPFQKACKFTTKTKTSSIIELRISSLSLPLNTSGYTLVADLKTESGISNAVNAKRQNQSQKNSGTSKKTDGYKAESVKDVLSKESANVERFVLRTVGSVRTIQKRTKVFNLTIDGIPAFDTMIGVSHNTMKPIKLVARAVRASSLQNDVVLDLFGGSGSTLVTCEKMKRKARLMELDPKYVDVIIKRWETLTGEKAKYIGNML